MGILPSDESVLLGSHYSLLKLTILFQTPSGHAFRRLYRWVFISSWMTREVKRKKKGRSLKITWKSSQNGWKRFEIFFLKRCKEKGKDSMGCVQREQIWGVAATVCGWLAGVLPTDWSPGDSWCHGPWARLSFPHAPPPPSQPCSSSLCQPVSLPLLLFKSSLVPVNLSPSFLCIDSKSLLSLSLSLPVFLLSSSVFCPIALSLL